MRHRNFKREYGVEYVMGFCSKEEHERFLQVCPIVEKFVADSGIQLIKFWLEVGDEEQKRRFEARIEDPLRQWKLSAMDLPSRSNWYAYSRARDQMLESTDTEHAPWHIVRSDDKRRARLNLIAHLPQPDSLQGSATGKGGAAQAIQKRRLRRHRLDREP
jgi:polyphosphate kinase